MPLSTLTVPVTDGFTGVPCTARLPEITAIISRRRNGAKSRMEPVTFRLWLPGSTPPRRPMLPFRPSVAERFIRTFALARLDAGVRGMPAARLMASTSTPRGRSTYFPSESLTFAATSGFFSVPSMRHSRPILPLRLRSARSTSFQRGATVPSNRT